MGTNTDDLGEQATALIAEGANLKQRSGAVLGVSR
jgi:hypothetical protein